MIKNILLCISLMALPGIAFTQTRTAQAKSSFKVGEWVPDIELRTVIDSLGKSSNSFGGRTRLSQFNGKLVIFDFWATFCGTCIENFPKMSALQERYKDQIQIFLVNPWQGEELVTKWRKGRIAGGDSSVIPRNLPMLLDSNMAKYFPTNYDVGYHVWIGKDRKYVLRGIHENTHAAKIEQYLAGQPVSFIPDNALVYNSDLPYAQTPQEMKALGLQFSSYFGLYNDSTVYTYGQLALDKTDSLTATRRNSYLNLPVDVLYKHAYAEMLQADTQVLFGNRMTYRVKDITSFTLDEKLLQKDVTDESIRKASFSYEQVFPNTLHDSVARSLMRRDLDVYFGHLLHASGNLVERKVDCYVISVLDSTKFKRSEKEMYMGSFRGADGKARSRYYGCFIGEALRHYLQSGFEMEEGEIVLNETNIGYPVDIELPFKKNIRSLQQLSDELRKIGLQFIKQPRNVRFLQISDM